jgi:hypothetical protein
MTAKSKLLNVACILYILGVSYIMIAYHTDEVNLHLCPGLGYAGHAALIGTSLGLLGALSILVSSLKGHKNRCLTGIACCVNITGFVITYVQFVLNCVGNGCHHYDTPVYLVIIGHAYLYGAAIVGGIIWLCYKENNNSEIKAQLLPTDDAAVQNHNATVNIEIPMHETKKAEKNTLYPTITPSAPDSPTVSTVVIEKDNRCGICRKECTNKTSKIVLTCGHTYHEQCYEPFLKGMDDTYVCPACIV